MQFLLKSDKNNGYFTWRLFTFMTISRWLLLRMRNVSYKYCRENQDTHCMYRAIYEIMWSSQRRCKRQYGGALYSLSVRLHWRKHTPALMHARTHPHAHTEIFNISCPHQWFRERGWMLRYTCIACLVTDVLLLLQNLRMVEQTPRENDRRSAGQEMTQPVMNSDL